MIQYRITRFEQARGMMDVEYGEKNSGVVVPIDIFRSVPKGTVLTEEVLHQICIQHRPHATIEAMKRVQTMPESELEVIASMMEQERQISDAEEISNPARKVEKMKVVDTSR